MPKLNLKRTPEEEAAKQLRKQRKREAKNKRKNHYPDDSRKRQRTEETNARKWSSSDDELEYGPQPGPSSPRPTPDPDSWSPDYDAIRAELEERKFREKMFEAFEDDERLDSLEARLNDFSHIPGRWKTESSGKSGKTQFTEVDDLLNMDTRYMDDEEYAEWIRAGMYRKTHAEEYAEQQRKKALKEARKAEEKARRAEAKRLEIAMEEERTRKKEERHRRQWDYAREEYDIRWKELLSSETRELRFHDIPWPILAAHRQKPDKRNKSVAPERTVLLEHLTMEAISEFLISSRSAPAPAAPTQADTEKKERKEKLRETFLRFHPDKFEGRFMKRVRESEREAVREAIGQVVRSLNKLMEAKL